MDEKAKVSLRFDREELAALAGALHTELWKVQEEIDRDKERLEQAGKTSKTVEFTQRPTPHERKILAAYFRIGEVLEPEPLDNLPDWAEVSLRQAFIKEQAPKPKSRAKPARRRRTKAAAEQPTRRRRRRKRAPKPLTDAQGHEVPVPPGPPQPPIPEQPIVG